MVSQERRTFTIYHVSYWCRMLLRSTLSQTMNWSVLSRVSFASAFAASQYLPEKQLPSVYKHKVDWSLGKKIYKLDKSTNFLWKVDILIHILNTRTAKSLIIVLCRQNSKVVCFPRDTFFIIIFWIFLNLSCLDML